MSKYEKIIKSFEKLLNEIKELDERERKILILVVESSILKDEISKLSDEKEKMNNL